MDATDEMVMHFLLKLSESEDIVCIEDHTNMGPVVHEESAQHAWAYIVFCLFVSELHGSA